MRALVLIFKFFLIVQLSIAQSADDRIRLLSEYSSDDPDIRRILRFEQIDYYKLKFIGSELKGKSYQLKAKEFWDGKLAVDSVIFDSKKIGVTSLETVNDTAFNMVVLAKPTPQNKLKVSFDFGRFTSTREFDVIGTETYSMRNVPQESRIPIRYNEKFYLFAYIMPYERADGSKSWCDVGSDAQDIEKWGEKFGLKHYILFEMIFQ